MRLLFVFALILIFSVHCMGMEKIESQQDSAISQDVETLFSSHQVQPSDLAAKRQQIAALKAEFQSVIAHVRAGTVTQNDLDSLNKILAAIDAEYASYPAQIQQQLQPIYARLTRFIQQLMAHIKKQLGDQTTPSPTPAPTPNATEPVPAEPAEPTESEPAEPAPAPTPSPSPVPAPSPAPSRGPVFADQLQKLKLKLDPQREHQVKITLKPMEKGDIVDHHSFDNEMEFDQLESESESDNDMMMNEFEHNESEDENEFEGEFEDDDEAHHFQLNQYGGATGQSFSLPISFQQPSTMSIMVDEFGRPMQQKVRLSLSDDMNQRLQHGLDPVVKNELQQLPALQFQQPIQQQQLDSLWQHQQQLNPVNAFDSNPSSWSSSWSNIDTDLNNEFESQQSHRFRSPVKSKVKSHQSKQRLEQSQLDDSPQLKQQFAIQPSGESSASIALGQSFQPTSQMNIPPKSSLAQSQWQQLQQQQQLMMNVPQSQPVMSSSLNWAQLNPSRSPQANLNLGWSQSSLQLQSTPTHSKGAVRYSQPIVTYAQPIIQKLDMAAPKIEKQHLTAEAIVQPTFQVAPVMQSQPISAQAPTIQKGFGTNIGLGHMQFGSVNPIATVNPNLNPNLAFSPIANTRTIQPNQPSVEMSDSQSELTLQDSDDIQPNESMEQQKQ